MSTGKKLRFSIVIPCYNEDNYIRETITSLKEQSFQGDYEIIVVNNNCNDQTVNIAKSLDVKVVDEVNPGVCHARQAGTIQARGEIIISTDADTTYDHDWLKRIDNKFKKYPNIVGVAGPCKYVDAPFWAPIYTKTLFGAVNFGNRVFRQTYYASATNIAFKKAAWEGYNTELTQGGDELDLLHSLRSHGRVIFDNTNPTFTSARRLKKGLLYTFFVSLLTYYLLEYYLSRIFNRPVLGSAPAFREDVIKPKRVFGVMQFASCVVIILAMLMVYKQPRHYIYHASQRGVDSISDAIKITE